MRIVLMTITVLGLTVPAMAQPDHAGHHAPAADQAQAAAGGGELPAGWNARLDRDGASLAEVNFRTMGTGFHATTGPAAIFYEPAHEGRGAFHATATFTQTKAAPSPEAYGLFVGGEDLSGAGQRYTYFLLRQDGKFLIKRRDGADTPTLVNWSDHSAVKKPDADGKMTNTLTVEVAADTVRFLVNGTEVATQPATAVDTEGIVGFRVNHNLDVHIDGFEVGAGKAS